MALTFIAIQPVYLRAHAAPGRMVIEDHGVAIDFPRTIAFGAHVQSTTGISRVVLEYRVDKRTCGKVAAKAFPAFDTGASADVSWTWEMSKSGAEPPGATIW